MVLLPILGATAKEFLDGGIYNEDINLNVLIAGFICSFISGLIACNWMLKIVKQGKLLYFGYYCLIVGIIALIAGIYG